MSKEFMVLFYGYKKDGYGPKQPKRDFIPFILDFGREHDAWEWAREHIDEYLGPKEEWDLRDTKVYSVGRISTPMYRQEMLLPEVIAAKEVRLRQIVAEFMDREFLNSYAFIMQNYFKDKFFKDDAARCSASAQFMIQPLKKNCEQELGDLPTFYAGSFNGLLQIILSEYFEKMDAEEARELAQGAAS